MDYIVNAWNQLALRLLAMVPFLATGWMLEACIPADRKPERNYVFNLTYTIVFWAIHMLVGAGFATWVAVLAAKLPGHGIIRLSPTTAIGIAGCLVLRSAIRDLFFYWFHRAQHTFTWLWAEHELHHSDEQMNVTTTWRHHWLELPFQSIFLFAPLNYLLELNSPGLVLASYAFDEVLAYFIHANARASLGPFNWLLCTPAVHRIHHSKEARHIDKNFAAICPAWDVLFGTYVAPVSGEVPETGLHNGKRVRTLGRALVLPFERWSQMARAAIGRQSGPLREPVHETKQV